MYVCVHACVRARVSVFLYLGVRVYGTIHGKARCRITLFGVYRMNIYRNHLVFLLLFF